MRLCLSTTYETFQFAIKTPEKYTVIVCMGLFRDHAVDEQT